MHLDSFKVSGAKVALENLRNELLAQPQATQIKIADLNPEPDVAPNTPVRVRQLEMGEAIFAFVIHVPAGVAAHMVYDWLRGWLKSRADAVQVRVQQVNQGPTASGTDDPT